MKRHAWDAAALGLVLAVAWLAHRFVLDLALLGWDSYPAVASSRADDLQELFAALTDRWMGGRYPRGDFYRPLSTLSLALDYRSWGLEPRGYQLGNLCALLFATGCTYGLARAWLAAPFYAALAALVFALHAAQLEVVPVAARRSDLLTAGWMAAALWAQPLGAAATRPRLALAAGCALLAVAAKETGVAVLPAIAVLHYAAAPRIGARLRRCVRRSLPSALAVLALLAVRTGVLGGLGGHPGSDLRGGWIDGMLAAPLWLRTLVMPQPWTESLLDPPLALAALLGLALAAGRLARTSRGTARGAQLAALAAWAGGLLLLMGISGDLAAWYLVPLAVPYAVLLASLIAAALSERRTAPRSAALAAGLCAALVASHVASSLLLRDYPQWRQVSEDTERFLGAFDVAVEATADGERVRVEGLPIGRATPLERTGVRSALGMVDYSAAAYAELRFPERRVRVFLPGGAPEASDDGAVDVEVVPAADGLALGPVQ